MAVGLEVTNRRDKFGFSTSQSGGNRRYNALLSGVLGLVDQKVIFLCRLEADNSVDVRSKILYMNGWDLVSSISINL